ncbi:hypothetical protein CBW65_05710 [Tumebacillus avium]|uniref:DUF4829 domain-containing protein n=1 Tax=Tumebacillus avium TaxID=1903704 RepID=A0A1Y0ILC4_9BACL|nr:hypothetical protein [Tumebacillus avium]ARU60636.1 hypothetical protein CBW65_05710 [Tumebacillus avium]
MMTLFFRKVSPSACRFFVLALVIILIVGCGKASESSLPNGQQEQPGAVSAPPSNPTSPTTPATAAPTGMKMGADGQLYLSKNGLQILTTPPESGPEEVAWRFFKLRGEQKYDEAVELLGGYLYPNYKNEPSRNVLMEVTASKFVRAADITKIAPVEGETDGAFARKVIYLEMNFKLRGIMSPESTDMRDGLNHYAVHLIQEKEGDPWKIVLLGGCPWLEK